MRDYSGVKFHKLTAVKFLEKRWKSKRPFWLFLCECGKEIEADFYNVRNGMRTSCGCSRAKIRIRHGHTKFRLNGKHFMSPTYISWTAMRQRCQNKKHTAYQKYGGRGITVCARWQKFDNFLEDMGLRPPGTSIDRLDNDKGYSKENCRWATGGEQSNNTSRNVYVEWNGQKLTASQLSRKLKVSSHAIKARLLRGWTSEEVFSGEKKGISAKELTGDRDKDIVRLRNEGRTLDEIGKAVGLSRERVRQIYKILA